MTEPETFTNHQTATAEWVGLEQRSATRYPMGLLSSCQLLCGEPPRLTEARVSDLSPCGIGLILAGPLAALSVLTVQLAPGPFLSARAAVARVVYCLPLADGGYQAGAEFVRRLTPDELRVLLS